MDSCFGVSNFWLGFWLDSKSSFRCFYVLIYCLKERVSIVRKTKVRNHRRVASSPSAEAISVTNTAFVGKGVVMIAASSTHLTWGPTGKPNDLFGHHSQALLLNTIVT